jgi:hypothetical protein
MHNALLLILAEQKVFRQYGGTGTKSYPTNSLSGLPDFLSCSPSEQLQIFYAQNHSSAALKEIIKIKGLKSQICKFIPGTMAAINPRQYSTRAWHICRCCLTGPPR